MPSNDNRKSIKRNFRKKPSLLFSPLSAIKRSRFTPNLLGFHVHPEKTAPDAPDVEGLHHSSFRDGAPSEIISAGAFRVFGQYSRAFARSTPLPKPDLHPHIFA